MNTLNKILTTSIGLASSLILSSKVALADEMRFSSFVRIDPNKPVQVWYEKQGDSCKKVVGGKIYFNKSCIATVNTKIDWSGQIFTNSNTKVEVICPDGKPRYIKPNHFRTGATVNSRCKGGTPDYDIGELSEEFRPGGIDISAPYVVSPRYTMVRSQQPVLQWHAVKEAKRYTVSLFHDRAEEPICTIQDVVEKPKNGIITIEFSRCQTKLGAYNLELGYFYKLNVVAKFADKEISSEEKMIDRNDYRA
jgi:hypothetical protein